VLAPELENLITTWYAAAGDVAREKARAALTLEPLTKRERELREKVIALAFPKTEEGTQSVAMPKDWVLKLKVEIKREVDDAMLDKVREQMAKLEIPANVDLLIRNKPELALREYRKLTDAQRKIFDQAITERNGNQTLELIAPKEKK
jgi:hypothetical protein